MPRRNGLAHYVLRDFFSALFSSSRNLQQLCFLFLSEFDG
jgi:hypothetical protein